MASRFWEKCSDSESSDETNLTDNFHSDVKSDSSRATPTSTQGGAVKYLLARRENHVNLDKPGTNQSLRNSSKEKGVEEETNQIYAMLHDCLAKNDWVNIINPFEKLKKIMAKNKRKSGSIPQDYIEVLNKIENALENSLRNQEPYEEVRLSQPNYKSLISMKQRLRKNNPCQRHKSIDKTFLNENTPAQMCNLNVDNADQFKNDSLYTMDPKNITFAFINKRLLEAKENRGKRGFDHSNQWETLTFLQRNAHGSGQSAAILLHLLSLLFDLTPAKGFLSATSWRKGIIYYNQLLDIIEKNRHVKVQESIESFAEMQQEPLEDQDVQVSGNLAELIEKFDEELYKALQQTEPHTIQFRERLQDELHILALSSRVSIYLRETKNLSARARVELRRLEHCYYKTSEVYTLHTKVPNFPSYDIFTTEESKSISWETSGKTSWLDPVKVHESNNLTTFIKDLGRTIFSSGDERSKTRALLCTVYHGSLIGDFFGSRNLLLMSRVQDHLMHLDFETQILYNRTIALMGLCGFRQGLLTESFQYLQELYSSNRHKEVLSQGSSGMGYRNRALENEKIEKKQRIPFPMRINMEILDSVYFIGSGLIEVSNLLRGVQQKTSVRPLQKNLDPHRRVGFLSVPDSVRDTMFSSCKALYRAQWSFAYGLIESLRCWSSMPIVERSCIFSFLEYQTKIIGLQAYLVSYSTMYNSFSLVRLCNLFRLKHQTVYGIICNLLSTSVLHGSFDPAMENALLKSKPPSLKQVLISTAYSKATILSDINFRNKSSF